MRSAWLPRPFRPGWSELLPSHLYQAGTPARMPSPPPPHFTPNPLPREAFSEGCLRFQTQSLYDECSTWLLLNLVGLCKNVYNETKKIGLMIISEGTRGKWVSLIGIW